LTPIAALVSSGTQQPRNGCQRGSTVCVCAEATDATASEATSAAADDAIMNRARVELEME